jgi:hypothetical protein
MRRQLNRFLVLTLLTVTGVGSALLAGGDAARGAGPAGLIFRDAPSRADDPLLLARHARTSTRPRVLMFSATPATLPASGGSVKLEALVANATRCRFGAEQSVPQLPRSARCAAGKASVTVRLAANTNSSQATYVFALKIRGRHGRITKSSVAVIEAGVPVPASPDTTAPPTPAASVTAAPLATPIEPVVTSDPTSETVVTGAPATFTAAASGTPAPSVQWQVSADSGATWAPLSGATSTTYSFTTSSADNGDEYEAVFTNAAGSATTDPATLTISAGTAPEVTTEPLDDSVAVGDDANFTAAASGEPTPTVQWQVSTDGGHSWGNLAGATSPSYDFPTIEAENGYQYRAVFTNAFSNAIFTATTNAVTLTLTDVPTSNWSGYAVSDETFTAVSGAWTVPTLDCGSHASAYSAHWIGIDGDTDDTVEQDGTEADCLGGAAHYDAWYELYGDSAVNNGYEMELSQTVLQGDAMSASVSVTDNLWTLTIADATQGWSYTTQPIAFTAGQSSAEWIGERPELCGARSCSLTPLADFGSLSFTGATATATGVTSPISAFSDYTPLEMVGNSDDQLAAPGPLDPTGEQFTDTWYASS